MNVLHCRLMKPVVLMFVQTMQDHSIVCVCLDIHMDRIFKLVLVSIVYHDVKFDLRKLIRLYDQQCIFLNIPIHIVVY